MKLMRKAALEMRSPPKKMTVVPQLLKNLLRCQNQSQKSQSWNLSTLRPLSLLRLNPNIPHLRKSFQHLNHPPLKNPVRSNLPMLQPPKSHPLRKSFQHLNPPPPLRKSSQHLNPPPKNKNQYLNHHPPKKALVTSSALTTENTL